jgi:hypothetical protein
VGLQEAIGGGRAHGEEQTAVFLTELKMPMLLQRFNDTGQERDQAFGADPVEGLPGQHQGLFDLRSIPTTKYSRRCEDLLCMIEQPLGIFARICGGGHELLQDMLLLEPRSLMIRRRNLLKQDPSGLRPQSISHVFLLSINQPEIACDRSLSAASRPSSFCQEYSAFVLVWPEIIGTLVSSWQRYWKPRRER